MIEIAESNVDKVAVLKEDLKKLNRKLHAYIYLAMDQASAYVIDGVIGESKDGVAAWQAMLKDWANRSDLRRNQLHQSLLELRMKNNDDCRIFTAEFMSMLCQLKECGLIIGDQEATSLLLRALPKGYQEFREMCAIVPPASLTQLIERLITISRSRTETSSGEKTTDSAFNATAKMGEARLCYNCGKPGHISRNCRKKKKAPASSITCYNCGKPGHLKRNCHQKKVENASVSFVAGTHSIKAVDSKIDGSIDWIIDSGTTRHVLW